MGCHPGTIRGKVSLATTSTVTVTKASTRASVNTAVTPMKTRPANADSWARTAIPATRTASATMYTHAYGVRRTGAPTRRCKRMAWIAARYTAPNRIRLTSDRARPAPGPDDHAATHG